MRIGELAALVGVTPRAVRHYHHEGLLPEPPRRPNGYREYGLRDAVRLARVRRLTALGLGLDEVRDVLADETGTELREVLGELDAELRRQEEEISARRLRLAELLRQAEDGTLPSDAPLSTELTGLFARAAGAGDERGPEPAIAAKDREVLALLETSTGPGARESVVAMAGAVTADEAGAERARHAYALLEELAEAAADDPRVEPAAHAVVACVPDESVRHLSTTALEAPEAPEAPEGPMPEVFAQALYADLAPAQAEAVRRGIALLTERARALAPNREERR
ncbi:MULTISPECIES: MerR family transcriptional regulator [unclassified Streptomyces]|uniref:MerR family transcriptional regulator n=1 Tax=unclassified Streptomyces TaxID=2593676 RepID=UPI002E11E4BB|nr:MerR family transcriptional regulator [Streptomyces sp. NBC_01186]WSS43403.1 MerR family transcriptional regulator [Streptomyces sp. NBC_01187]